jgi:hypothetical protein
MSVGSFHRTDCEDGLNGLAEWTRNAGGIDSTHLKLLVLLPAQQICDREYHFRRMCADQPWPICNLGDVQKVLVQFEGFLHDGLDERDFVVDYWLASVIHGRRPRECDRLRSHNTDCGKERW